MKAEIPHSAASPNRRTFTQQFSATPRGARCARLLASAQLAQWGWPYRSEFNHTATLAVAELTANAARHAAESDPFCQVHLAVRDGVLRIEVTDSGPTNLPYPVTDPGPACEAGRGLLLVSILSDRWGVTPRDPAGKVVWCELALR